MEEGDKGLKIFIGPSGEVVAFMKCLNNRDNNQSCLTIWQTQAFVSLLLTLHFEAE